MIIIGDVHGRVLDYMTILSKYSDHPSIQVGDFGFKWQHDLHLKHVDSQKHKINFGNHDYYPYLDKPHSCGDYSLRIYEGGPPIVTIRGAWSIDKRFRVEGKSWFEQEQIPYKEWEKVIDFVAQHRPRIVVSHDCPAEVRNHFFGIYDKDLTSSGLQHCFEIHQPELWIFGHHHEHRNEIINGTRFVCLDELKTFVI